MNKTLVYCKGYISTKRSALTFLTQMSSNINLLSLKHSFLYYPAKHILRLHFQYTKEIKATVWSMFKGWKKSSWQKLAGWYKANFKNRRDSCPYHCFHSSPGVPLLFPLSAEWSPSGYIRYSKVTTPFCTDHMTAMYVHIISRLAQYSWLGTIL